MPCQSKSRNCPKSFSACMKLPRLRLCRLNGSPVRLDTNTLAVFTTKSVKDMALAALFRESAEFVIVKMLSCGFTVRHAQTCGGGLLSLAAVEQERPWALQRPERVIWCSVGAAPSNVSLPHARPVRQEYSIATPSNNRCIDGCFYCREVITPQARVRRICQFCGHKVKKGDYACDFFPGQPWEVSHDNA